MFKTHIGYNTQYRIINEKGASASHICKENTETFIKNFMYYYKYDSKLYLFLDLNYCYFFNHPLSNHDFIKHKMSVTIKYVFELMELTDHKN
jgi:hypothetical protein